MTGDAGALAHELPYWGWVDERTCLTRAGELVTVGALTPVVTDGRTAEDLDAVAGRWQRMLSGLPPEMRVSWIVERRQAAFDLRPPGTDIAGLAQRKRQAFLEGRVQDLDVHVVWSFDPGLRRTAGTRGRGGGGGRTSPSGCGAAARRTSRSTSRRTLRGRSRPRRPAWST